MDLKKLKELCQKATDSPWQTRFLYRSFKIAKTDPGLFILAKSDKQLWDDSEFIAASRTAVPELIEEVEKLRDILDCCRDWMHTQLSEDIIECRGDDECDHCVGLQYVNEARRALGRDE